MAGKESPMLEKELKNLFSRANFPATKEDIIGTAEEEGCAGKVLEILSRLPNRNFQSPEDVFEEAHHNI